MAPTVNVPAVLHRLKRETPFVPFEVVTSEGQRFRVGDPFRFAFNDRYVLLQDVQDKMARLKHGEIVSIEEQRGVGRSASNTPNA